VSKGRSNCITKSRVLRFFYALAARIANLHDIRAALFDQCVAASGHERRYSIYRILLHPARLPHLKGGFTAEGRYQPAPLPLRFVFSMADGRERSAMERAGQRSGRVTANSEAIHMPGKRGGSTQHPARTHLALKIKAKIAR
jgi:hypothetical protein